MQKILAGKKHKMSFMKQYNRYPLEKTKFKTENYRPGDHFRIPLRWDNFTLNVPIWQQVIPQFFGSGYVPAFKVLELGSGNGLCSNYLLDKFNCTIDTVDINDHHIIEEDDKKYLVSTSLNLRPFIDSNRCTFHNMTTREFMHTNLNNRYDFIYVDASHDPDWVLYDAVNAFELLKDDGLMIFDDYGMKGCAQGVNAFLSCYKPHVEVFYKDWQLMLRKKSSLKAENDKD